MVEAFEEDSSANERIKLVTWFLLLVVLMTFAGIVAAYMVVSSNQALEWNPFELPVQVWISTGLLLGSSLILHFSNRARVAGYELRSRNLLLVVGLLGGVFVASQLLVWWELFQEGYYLKSNPYAGFFYFLTVLHALHIIGGISALGYLVLRSWFPTMDDRESALRLAWSKAVGLYWHCMDGLWLVLVLLLAFWK